MENTDKKPLIVLTGPTAVGKTELSIELAKAVNGEIISADSVQVYRHMDIGSAKIAPQEMQGVRHHLIDILEPTDDFNVCLFKKYVDAAMNDIWNRGKIPVLVGGTGFYIQAVLYDIDFEEEPDEESIAIREELEQTAALKGNSYMFEMLRKIDPESCNIIHENNLKRVIRAIEYYRLTGESISKHNAKEHAKQSPYNSVYFVLDLPRDILYERIDRRVDIMIKDGLLEEVKKLIQIGCTRECTSMQALGYKEILDCVNGNKPLEDAVYEIKRDTRHFAKRQLTWFRRERDVTWIEKKEFDGNQQILEYMLEKCRQNGICQ